MVAILKVWILIEQGNMAMVIYLKGAIIRAEKPRGDLMIIWNPWHGCRKISEGCKNCYVYRRDSQFGKDSSVVTKTASFLMPLNKDRKREYKLKDEVVYTCMTSDFFIEEADPWREDIWKIIKKRKDLSFNIITKRIDRFELCKPMDWGDGYDNVRIYCTCENQEMADYRLPIFLKAKIKHKAIIHEPMLSEINIEKYLEEGDIEEVICGGESGENARLCDYKWILKTREQCLKYKVDFFFKQTGAVFKKGDKIYHIDRKYQMEQAQRANISFKSREEKAEDKGVYDLDSYIRENKYNDIFERLAKSAFRSKFYLTRADKDYVRQKGMDKIREHTYDFINKRLAPKVIENDGKQTPMRGHPTFKAQHGTATCCRGCLKKWHNIGDNKELSTEEKDYIVDIIMKWIEKQMNK